MRSGQPVFTVRSVNDAIDWYQDILGFEAVFRSEPAEKDSLDYAVLLNGNAGLHLGCETAMENIAGQGACNFVTKEFNQVLRSVKDAGVPFYINLSEIPSGQRTFGIKDPDGNLIRFVEVA